MAEPRREMLEELALTGEKPAPPYGRLLRQPDDRRWRRMAYAALLASVLPVSLGADGGLYLWELLRVAGPADALRLLSPVLLALALLALSVAPRLTRLGQSTAVLGLLALATVAFTGSRVAFHEAFSGLLQFVGRRPLLVTLGLVLLASGGELRSGSGELGVSPTTQRVARALLVAGSALTTLVYLLPQRGQPFALLIGERMLAAARYGGARLVAGQVLFWLLALLPLGLSLGAMLTLRRRGRAGILLPLGARYGLSGLAVLLCFRLLLGEFSPHAVLLQIRTAVLLAVAIGTAAGSIESIVRHLLDDSLPPLPPRSPLARDVRLRQLLRGALRTGPGPAAQDETPPGLDLLGAAGVAPSHPWLGWLIRRRLGELGAELPEPVRDPSRPDFGQARAFLALLESRSPGDEPAAPLDAESEREPVALWLCTGRRRLPSAIGAALVLGALVLGAALYRPKPELDWTLAAPTTEADELLGTALPRYVVALSHRSELLAQQRSGAEALQLLRQQELELGAAATRTDGELGRRIDRLVRAADALDRTGQLWIDAVHGVNRRIRQLGLPYYVDGNVVQVTSRVAESTRRVFYVTTYRVEQVHRFADRGRPYAALHVRRLDRLNLLGARLGATRRDEPFALVMVDVIAETVKDRLDSLAAASSCGFGRERVGDLLDDPLAAIGVDEACGAAIGALLAARGLDLGRTAEPAQAAELLVALQIDATERHEIQHQVDGEELDVPRELFAFAPWADDEGLTLVSQEASAHLAELCGDDPLATAWRLADLTSFLLERGSRNPYRFAAALVVGHLRGRPVMDRMGNVAVGEVRALWADLAAHPADIAKSIAPLARKAHEDLFGAPLAALPPLDPASLPGAR